MAAHKTSHTRWHVYEHIGFIARPCLEYQYRELAIFAQPIGQNTSGGASSHAYKIILGLTVH